MGYLSTLLVCKAVQVAGRLGGHIAGRGAFSCITCLNKRNLPKANKAKYDNKNKF